VPALAGVGNVGMLPRRRKKMKVGDLVKYRLNDDDLRGDIEVISESR